MASDGDESPAERSSLFARGNSTRKKFQCAPDLNAPKQNTISKLKHAVADDLLQQGKYRESTRSAARHRSPSHGDFSAENFSFASVCKYKEMQKSALENCIGENIRRPDLPVLTHGSVALTVVTV